MNQSVLAPASDAAQSIAGVSWWLFGGGAAIFAGVMLLLALSLRGRRNADVRLWLLGGGVMFPSVVLAALFAYSVADLPAWRAAPPPGALIVGVTGRMWWWELRYRDPATGAEIVTANELRIPVGRPVYLALASTEVIHSFWVPALAGKMDMIPGRVTHLLLQADRAGIYRGQCAEFCGEQHALMAMQVHAMPGAEFDGWLAAQARDAAEPATEQQRRGQRLFAQQRCDACHAVRGTAPGTPLGPDLTHLASRSQLAAGTLPNTESARRRWITHTQEVKPGARMPASPELDTQELDDLAAWLGSLR